MHLTKKEQLARQMVCLPLDGLSTLLEVKARIEELSPVVGMFKIGKETYTRFGPEAISLVHSCGAEVFLDLKYHDIPNTVNGAADAATQLGVFMFNVHASGGKEMMLAAREGAIAAAKKYNKRLPKIIAVTVLTSLDKNILNNQLNVPGEVEKQVLSLASLANEAGMDGIVCSAADLNAVKSELPKDFMYVTPGIKGPDAQVGSDQKRVSAPGNAVKAGASVLVIGRAITGRESAKKRLEAGYEILQDIARVL